MIRIFILFILFFINFNNIALGQDIPNPQAKSAILIDTKSGRILYKKNETQELAMASTTKIMTAILAIEKGNLKDVVKVSKRASKAPPVKMHLKEGEEIKLQELLYALMLQSSNDAAVAIAENISKDVETFCKLMTEKSKEIGAKNTVFKTPNGLDLEDHHSTAYDMAIIAKYALNNKIFREIINTKEVSFKTNKNNYKIINKNRLLNEYEGATGIKTGYTGKAGHCFVGSAKKDDMELISVVLASGWGNKGKAQKWIDTKEILNYGFKNFKYEKILNKNDLKKVKINKGYKEFVNIEYKDDIILPIKDDEKNNIKILNEIEENIEAPINIGEKIGICKILINNELVKEVDIISKEKIDKKSLIYNLNKIIKNWSNLIK